MKKLIIYLLIFFIVAGCSREKKVSVLSKDSFKTIEINPEKVIDKNFNDIIKKPAFIQLETTSDCFLKGIYKIQICKNRIYIYDFNNGGKIFCFNMQGKYLFTVGTRGNGPGEYIYLKDMHVDEPNGYIWLGDDGKKILKYDLDGKFIEQYTTEYSINNIIPIEKDIMAIRLGYYADKNYSFITYSIKDKKIFYYKNAVNSIDRYVGGGQVFSKFNREIIYASGFTDTIFNVNESGLIPKYAIDFGKYRVPEYVINDENNKNLIVNFLNPENRYAGLIRNCYETDDYIIFSYDYAGDGLLSYCFKGEDEKIETIREIDFYGKKFNAAKYFFGSKTNEGYISFLESHLLTENEENDDLRQTFGVYSDLDELLSNLRIEDNPILILGDVIF